MWKLLLIVCTLFSTLHANCNILAFAGSTRNHSLNKKLILETAKMASQMDAHVTVIDLKSYPLPFYDEDLETADGIPQNAILLQQLLSQNDCIIISSPEYNSSLSAVLKNTIDWISRIEEHEEKAFCEKTFILMSASPGSRGGSGGLEHLQKIIASLGGKVFPKKIVLAYAGNAFDEKSCLKSDVIKKEIQQVLHAAMQDILKDSSFAHKGKHF